MTAAAASRTQPNLIKLARELGISPALMNDTIEALGGFNSLWTRAQQDQAAENSDPDLEYFPA
jgi:phage terminase small subunit